MSPSVSVRGVSKRFGPVCALRGISLVLEPGDGCAVVGENGAGKSTLARVLAGFVSADEGEVFVAGLRVKDPGVVGERMGFLSGEERGFFPRLSGHENLRIHAMLHGMGATAFRKRLHGLSERLELQSLLPRRAEQLSSGQRQRLALARALLHDPEVLVLDEPDRSLDAAWISKLFVVLGELRRKGKTVLLCTHRVEEARRVCNRTVVLREGEVFPSDVHEAPSFPPPGLRRTGLRHALRAGLRKAYLEEKSYALGGLLELGGIGLECLSFYFLGRLVGQARLMPLESYGGDYFPFVLVWLLFQEWQSGALHAIAMELRQSQLTGTLEATLLATRYPLVFWGASPLWALLRSATLSLSFIGIWCATGGRVSLPGIGMALMAALLAWLACLGIGMVGAACVLVFRRGTVVLSCYAALSALIGGGYYPTEVMPRPLQVLAEAFPLTAALRTMRGALLGGRAAPEMAKDFAFLGLFAAGLLATGVWSFRLALRVARARGGLVTRA